MKILNEQNQEISLSDVDTEKGHLKLDTITHHVEAVAGSEGKSHIEVVHEYPNGGRDVTTVWDTPPVKAVPAHDETEQIQRYVLYTDAELAERRAQKEALEKAALVPMPSDLSDASVDLAQSVSDIGDGVTELGDLIAALDERLSALEGGSNNG